MVHLGASPALHLSFPPAGTGRALEVRVTPLQHADA